MNYSIWNINFINFLRFLIEFTYFLIIFKLLIINLFKQSF